MQNILIADDHSIVRAGLKLLINSCIRDVTIDEAEVVVALATGLECGCSASSVGLEADWRTYRLPAGRASVN